jgi:hypothetical protein
LEEWLLHKSRVNLVSEIGQLIPNCEKEKEKIILKKREKKC